MLVRCFSDAHARPRRGARADTRIPLFCTFFEKPEEAEKEVSYLAKIFLAASLNHYSTVCSISVAIFFRHVLFDSIEKKHIGERSWYQSAAVY